MNGKTHQAVAIPAGVGGSWIQTEGQPLGPRILEGLGAGCAASLGARLPDWWDDPANGPHHRSWAHSVALAGGVGSLCAQRLPAAQGHLRALAAGHAEAARVTADPLVRIWHTLCEWLYRFLSGALVGLAVGYGSHLALDAFTPRSLPLIY